MSQRDDSGASHETPENFNTVSHERDTYPPSPQSWAAGSPSPLPQAPAQGGWTHDETRTRPRAQNQRVWPAQSWPPRKNAKRGRPPWVVPVLAAIVSAGVAVGLVLFFGGASGKPSPAPTPPAALSKKTSSPAPTGRTLTAPITLAAAKSVLSTYSTTINAADAAFSSSLLTRADAQGSYSLIADHYRQGLAAHGKPTANYAPTSARYYIPLEAAAYPHWFAVRVDNATTGKKPASLGTQYLVFTQSAAGAGWKEVDQPDVLVTAPNIRLNAAGYATAVSASAAGFALAPGKLAAATANSLNGSGSMPVPGNLRDTGMAASWRHSLPRGSRVSLTHAAAGYQVFGLQTTGGGALFFYTDTGQVTATPPKRKTLKLSVPGYYNSKQRLKSATLGFLDQFAAYDPPVTIPGLTVIADYSGVVS